MLLTPEAVKSEWVLYEIRQAKENGCSIIPLLIRTCDIPSELESIQYIDFQQGIDGPFKNLQRALLLAIVRSSPPSQTSQAAPFSLTSSQPHQLTPNSEKMDRTEIASSNEARKMALVIEDVENYQILLRDLLSELGLEVHVAGTRNEAATLIRSHVDAYSFITLDMQLGPDDEFGQEGIYLLDLLKRYQEHTPIVMITSLSWDKAKVRDFFRKYKITDMLDKPFDQAEFRALVQQYIPGLEAKDNS